MLALLCMLHKYYEKYPTSDVLLDSLRGSLFIMEEAVCRMMAQSLRMSSGVVNCEVTVKRMISLL